MYVGRAVNIMVSPAARVQRSRVTEETFGVAPGWGRDGLYVGRAANMEVAPAALGKRSRVTGETVGAVSGGDAGKWGPRRLERWKSCKMRVAPAARGQRSRVTAGVRQRRLVRWKRLQTWRLHPLRGGNACA